MTIYDLKPAFQGLLRPLTRSLAAASVTANQVTLFACALSLLTGLALYLRPDNRNLLFLVPLLLFVRMALNAIDGMLAREHGMKSRLGGVLNELTDVISDAGLYLPFALIPGMPSALIVTAVILAGITEMTGVVAVTIGADRRYDGPMGKSDRAFVFGALSLALGFGVSPGVWALPLFAIVNALLVLTVFNRARRALSTEGAKQ